MILDFVEIEHATLIELSVPYYIVQCLSQIWDLPFGLAKSMDFLYMHSQHASPCAKDLLVFRAISYCRNQIGNVTTQLSFYFWANFDFVSANCSSNAN